ncbi:MAG: DUF1491 family protein [Pseudomonadota bacterium]
MARLTARFWIDAYLARLRVHDISAFVVVHGDDTAGSVLVKINTLNGFAAVYQRQYDFASDGYLWEKVGEGEEREVDARIEHSRGQDPDLWVVEVEDRAGRHLLDEPGLA